MNFPRRFVTFVEESMNRDEDVRCRYLLEDRDADGTERVQATRTQIIKQKKKKMKVVEIGSVRGGSKGFDNIIAIASFSSCVFFPFRCFVFLLWKGGRGEIGTNGFFPVTTHNQLKTGRVRQSKDSQAIRRRERKRKSGKGENREGGEVQGQVTERVEQKERGSID